MKNFKFLAALCCMLAVFTACEKNEPNDNGVGSVSAATGTEKGHGYVNLGLPSGTKWATCNVGATTPEEYGNYYAWGEITTKESYGKSNYKWSTGPYYLTSDYYTITKYNTDDRYGTVDNKIVLDLEDDAAHVNWGGAWRMPSYEDWKELFENSTWTWTTLNGIEGYIVKSKINNKSIFLPAAGYSSYDGYYGMYLSSSLESPYNAWHVYFCSDGVYWGGDFRYRAYSVRPVR